MSTLRVNNVTDLGLDAVVTDGVVEKGALPSGSVLQVVSATTTTPTTTTSASYSNTSLSATITPISVDSKVLVQVSVAYLQSLNVASAAELALYRGGVAGTQLAAPLGVTYQAENVEIRANVAFFWLDSPSTTSATTYTLAIRSNGAGQTSSVNDRQVMILMEIAG